MVLTTAITNRLALFLGVPRKYAVGWNGGWRRVHEDINPEQFHELLATGPLCVAVRGTNGHNDERGYTGDQHFAIFDVDAENNIDGAKIAADELARKVKAREGYDCLVTFSGKKGFHIWVFFTADIHHVTVARWQDDLLRGLGYARTGAHVYAKDNVNVETLITFGDNNGLVIKVPFSRHQSREGFYEIPITVDRILLFDKDALPTEADWSAGVAVFEAVQQVDDQLFMSDAGGADAQIPEPTQGTRRETPTVRRDLFEIPETSAAVARILHTVRETPCLKACMSRARSQHGIYNERAVLVSVLARKNFTREAIAVFFRDHINDEEDNERTRLNGTLQYQINYWYPRSGLCSCRVLQNENGNFHVCPRQCGRTAPHVREQPHRISRSDWRDEDRPIGMCIDSFLASPDENNLQVFATTRSRKTTETVLSTIYARKKAVVLVPRLSIAENTGADILTRAATAGHAVYSCMIPDNRNMCLALARDVKEQYERHTIPEGCTSALEQLPHVDKPSCSNCRYQFMHETTIEPNKIYGKADVERNICGYQTILAHAEKWNLIWMSNAKFTSIGAFQEMFWQTPINRDILSSAEVYILDEVGDILQTPSFEMPLYWMTTDETPFEFWFIHDLNEEIRQLSVIFTAQRMRRNRGYEILRGDSTDAAPVREHERIRQVNELTALLGEKIRINVDRMRTNPDDDAFKYPRDVTPQEMEELKKASRVISKCTVELAKENNVALVNLQNLLALGQELQWIFTNVPTEDYSIRVNVLIAPKVAELVGLVQSSSSRGVKIIALDAVPPIISLDDVFEKPFTKVNFGDPAHTNDKFLIIPDSAVVMASDLMDNVENARRLQNALHWSDELFGDDKIGVLATSKQQADWIKGLVYDLEEIDILHHRGSRTMGVAYERRIGISVCIPNPPVNSNHWMKLVDAYEEPLRNVSASQLQKHDQARQTMQAEGRFKDPQGEAPSVVFAFGQTDNIVKDSYLNSIAPPRVINTIQQHGSENECPIQLVQAAIWLKTLQVIDDHKDLKAIISIMRGRDDMTIQNNSRATLGRIQELRTLLRDAVPNILP